MRRIVLVIVFLIGFTFISKVFAFDNQRKGFILGVGLGGGLVSETSEIKTDWYNYKSDRSNGFGPATNFQIGYALTKIRWQFIGQAN